MPEAVKESVKKLREKEANFAVEIKSLTEKYEAELVAERNKYLSLQKDMEKLQKDKENENQAITMDHLRTIESLKDQLQKLQKTNEKVLYDIAEIKQQKVFSIRYLIDHCELINIKTYIKNNIIKIKIKI